MKRGILVISGVGLMLTACGEKYETASAGTGYQLSTGQVSSSSNSTPPAAVVNTPPATPVVQPPAPAPVQAQAPVPAPVQAPVQAPVPPPVQVQTPTPTIPAPLGMMTPTAAEIEAANARRNAVDAVTSFYRYYLGRDPEAAGLDYWVNKILSGTNLNDVGQGIANSPEAVARKKMLLKQEATVTISRYYRLHLGREPDTGGLNYYVDLVVNKNFTLAQIEHEIRYSPEAAVRGSYLRHLNREPDQAGLRYYVNQVNSGRPFGQVDEEIRLSPESQIRQMYLRYLKREPDAGGFAYWIGQANSGIPLSQIDNAIRNSPEALSK